MSENVINDNNTGELLTLNQITEITGGHYQTVKKVVDRYVKDNLVDEGTIYRRNRPFPAYKFTHTQLAEIQLELQQIKKSNAPVKKIENDTVKMSETAQITREMLTSAILNENETMKMQNNVKFYEVVKKNNELENQVRMLQANMKDLEIEKTKEISSLNAEKVKFESDLYKTQADLKLITDKSATMEAEWSKQKLEVERLQKVVRNRNIVLILLGAVLLVIIAVSMTLYLARIV